MLEYARTIEGDDDYPSNLRSMAAHEHLSSKHIGLMASAVSGCRSQQEQEAKAEADRATPALDEWAGAEKDKLAQIPATIIRRKPMSHGDYPNALFIMRDGEGRTLKWLASNPPADVDDVSSVMIDSATIKRLGTY